MGVGKTRILGQRLVVCSQRFSQAALLCSQHPETVLKLWQIGQCDRPQEARLSLVKFVEPYRERDNTGAWLGAVVRALLNSSARSKAISGLIGNAAEEAKRVGLGRMTSQYLSLERGGVAQIFEPMPIQSASQQLSRSIMIWSRKT